MTSNMNTIVAAASGKLQGVYENGFYSFKGIPYAAPPVGELRWLPPQPVTPWKEVRPALQYGTIAPQNIMPGVVTEQVPQPQSEDCMFINVRTPGLDNAKRPVMVWIHGGAFVMGSGSDPMYDSNSLLKHGDVVLVTFNYRIGMLGFLRLKDVTGGAIPSTGNEGLLDQVQALKWVKDNIAAFGGDPDNVTIFGESAGSMSIACLMVMPEARGLFHKCIMESGTGSVAVPKEVANGCAGLFLEYTGLQKNDANAMRALAPEQLLELENRIRMASKGTTGMPAVTSHYPVIDGEIIPDVPAKLALQGAAKGIPAIIGSNLDEYTLFSVMDPSFPSLTDEEMMKRLAVMLPDNGAETVADAYRKAMRKRGMPDTPPVVMTAILTDLMFRMPSLDLVEAQRANDTPVYNYVFTWNSPAMGGIFKACHGLEIGFVFGACDPAFHGSGPDADRLSECMQDAWISFVKTGNPSSDCLGTWPEYGSQRMTMVLGKESRLEAAPFDDERAVWEKVKRYDTFIL